MCATISEEMEPQTFPDNSDSNTWEDNPTLNISVRNIGPITKLYAYFKIPLLSILTYYSKPMFYYYFISKICP